MHRVTLTFDNGPTPQITDRVLEVLGRVGSVSFNSLIASYAFFATLRLFERLKNTETQVNQAGVR